ncbi:MAG TPA: hypothetical protein VK456_08540 [Xanthobacteraceae bacterium]|nr:hypothetical protein [Xanthobacteraceae bacterium]
MGRLIEVQDPTSVQEGLTIEVGDVLLFRATGGRIRSGADAVELLGPFVESVVGTNGQIFSPTAPPNTLLLRASHPGQADVEVVTGDPWREHGSTRIAITVEACS